MGACATKPGDLKVKGEAPVVVEDAAAAPPPLAAADEKAKAGDVPVAAAAEVDHADVSRRRSLSVLLKQDAEASDGEADADHQEAEKVVVVAEEEAASAADAAAAAGETAMGSPQAPVQASVATTEHDDTAEEPKNDDLPSGGDVQAAEEEKRVDPESVQVTVAPSPEVAAAAPESVQVAAAAPESVQVADAAPSSEERKVADGDDTSA